MTSSTSNSRLALALAIVGPLLVLVPAVLTLNREEALTVSAAASAMDQRLAKSPPDVVIVGNSVAQRSVDLERLGRELGTEKLAIQDLHVDASRPPTWYAVLENRVFEKGYRPKLVVVIALLEVMLATNSEGTSAVLADYLEPDDTVVLEKTLGTDVGLRAFYRMRRRGDSAKMAILEGIRNFGVGLFLSQETGSMSERGRKTAEPALARVFDADGAVDLELKARVVPVVEEEQARLEVKADDPQASYIPDIVGIAKNNGSKVVFVRVPVSSKLPIEALPPGVEGRVVEYLNTLGAGWIDLSEIDIDDRHFADLVHLNAEGRGIFTEALASRLKAMKALEASPLPANLMPLAPSRSSRSGKAPAIPPLTRLVPKKDSKCAWRATIQVPQGLSDPDLVSAGAGLASPIELLEDGKRLRAHVDYAHLADTCSGAFKHIPDTIQFAPAAASAQSVPDHAYEVRFSPDFPMKTGEGRSAWWLYPGTSARFEFEERWERGPFVVTATALSFGSSDRAPFLQATGSESIRMSGAGSLLKARLEGDAPASGPWSIEITSPAGGPYLLLQSLVVGEGESASTILGKSSSDKGSSLVMVGSRKPPVEFSFEAPPPALPAGPPSLAKGMVMIPFKGRDYLIGSNIKKVTEAKACNIVQLLDNGAPASLDYTSCSKLTKEAVDGWCFGRGAVWVRPSKLTDLQAAEHQWSLRLVEGRECAEGRFLYPGDRLRIRVKRENLSVGADLLEARGHMLEDSGADEELHLVLKLRGKTILDVRHRLSEFKGGLAWDLGGRIPPGESNIEVELESPASAAFFILGNLSLVESRPFDEISSL